MIEDGLTWEKLQRALEAMREGSGWKPCGKCDGCTDGPGLQLGGITIYGDCRVSKYCGGYVVQSKSRAHPMPASEATESNEESG